MISLDEIRQVASDIGKAAHAERVILFGSHATGHATENSDLDLLVVAESDQPRHKRSRELYKNLQPHRIPVDILVYTPAEMKKAGRTSVSFVSQVMKEGKAVYVR